MKVQTARIRLILKTGKTLADGSHPIMLYAAYNGKHMVSTGYSCTAKYWDKKNECIRKGFPNYAIINERLFEMKSQAIQRKMEYEKQGLPYTPQMILAKKTVEASPYAIDALVNDYIVSRGISKRTSYNWQSFLNSLDDRKMLITAIDASFVTSYVARLRSRGMKDGAIKQQAARLKAICSYAVEKGLISETPFINLKLKLKPSTSLQTIHPATMDFMKSYFLDKVIVENNGMWHWKDKAIDELLDRNSSLFALYYFMAIFTFQGMSPVDLAMLKKIDMDIITVNGVNYWAWNVKRSKTGIPVKIRIKQGVIFNNVMVNTMLLWHNSEYLLPVLDDATGDLKARVSHNLCNLTPKLREWFRIINEAIVKHNVETGDNITLIDVSNSYYSARHAFCLYFMSKGGSALALSSLIGHQVNSISVYLKQLSEENDLASAVDIL